MTPYKQIQQKLYPDAETLKQTILRWKSQNQRIIFTNGCFDILHPGHIDYLAKAAGLGDKLIIGLNTDASVSRLKGPNRPIQNNHARAMVIAALGFVDAVVLFNEDTPQQLIEILEPDTLVKGADYNIDQIIGAETIIYKGGNVVLLPYLKGYSTTAIEKKIKEQ